MGLYLGSFGGHEGPMEWLEANGQRLNNCPKSWWSGWWGEVSFPTGSPSHIVLAVPQVGYPAAGVMFSQAELDRWVLASATRATWWYLVPLAKVRAVLPEVDAWIAIGDIGDTIEKEERMPRTRNETGSMVTHMKTATLGEHWDLVEKHAARTGAGLTQECREFIVIWHAVGRRSTLCEILNQSGGRISLGIAHRGRPCERCGQGGDKQMDELGQTLSLWRAIKNLAEAEGE